MSDKIRVFSLSRAAGRGEIKKSNGETANPIEVDDANEDRFDLSTRAAEVGKYIGQLKEMPELREEKISRLREQISSGNYNPSSEDIADAILKDEKF